jgi:hypothetical protein
LLTSTHCLNASGSTANPAMIEADADTQALEDENVLFIYFKNKLFTLLMI